MGYADPIDVSEHLRLGSLAFHAGDHVTARGVFEALLPPIAVEDIDLGQHESRREGAYRRRAPRAARRTSCSPFFRSEA
ncbi:MAG: hypothetical protein ABJA98_17230 [Acidobacteriota bacterium]